MIVDARAISYNQMVMFTQKQPFELQGEPIQPYDTIKIISITDKELPKIFNDSDDVLTSVFADIEPTVGTYKPSFIPDNPDYMVEEHAVGIIEFLEKIHALPEKVLLLVNCRHGIARSGAVVDYTSTVYGIGYWNNKRRNPGIVPNQWVSYLLFKEHFKRIQQWLI